MTADQINDQLSFVRGRRAGRQGAPLPVFPSGESSDSEFFEAAGWVRGCEERAAEPPSQIPSLGEAA